MCDSVCGARSAVLCLALLGFLGAGRVAFFAPNACKCLQKTPSESVCAFHVLCKAKRRAPIISHKFISRTAFPIFFAILMGNYRIIIGNVVEWHGTPFKSFELQCMQKR